MPTCLFKIKIKHKRVLDPLLRIYMYMFHTPFIFTHVIDAKHCGANHLGRIQNRNKTCLDANHPVKTCLRPQMILILVVAFLIFLGGIFSCIQLCLLKSVRKGGIYMCIPSDSYDQSYSKTRASLIRSHLRTINRPIIWFYVLSYRSILQHKL